MFKILELKQDIHDEIIDVKKKVLSTLKMMSVLLDVKGTM